MPEKTQQKVSWSRLRNIVDLQRKPGPRRSISFSIAHARMCAWANNPNAAPRPKPGELDKAENHAKYLGDFLILNSIEECRGYYSKLELTQLLSSTRQLRSLCESPESFQNKSDVVMWKA